MLKKLILASTTLAAAASPALAHIGAGATASFAAGLHHPLSGFDHMTVMVAVGLWATLKGGRALWAWPLAFVAVMLAGGGLGMAQMPLPLVEPVILASVVALGLMVALAVDLPLAAGAAIIGGFALFHGHAHGSEVPQAASGALYMAGFALATAGLHLCGLAFGLALGRPRWRAVVRGAGAVCAAAGFGLALGVI